MTSRMRLESQDDLTSAYTPGVARPCEEIAKNPGAAWDLTWKGRTVALVSDDSAVRGLGDIGPKAALPVMESKARPCLLNLPASMPFPSSWIPMRLKISLRSSGPLSQHTVGSIWRIFPRGSVLRLKNSCNISVATSCATISLVRPSFCSLPY